MVSIASNVIDCHPRLVPRGRPSGTSSLPESLLPELVVWPQLMASATLVELDPHLAASASEVGSLIPGVDVRHGDAGDVTVYADVLSCCARSSATSSPQEPSMHRLVTHRSRRRPQLVGSGTVIAAAIRASG
jgi:hypothetical protein